MRNETMVHGPGKARDPRSTWPTCWPTSSHQTRFCFSAVKVNDWALNKWRLYSQLWWCKHKHIHLLQIVNNLILLLRNNNNKKKILNLHLFTARKKKEKSHSLFFSFRVRKSDETEVTLVTTPRKKTAAPAPVAFITDMMNLHTTKYGQPELRSHSHGVKTNQNLLEGYAPQPRYRLTE